MNSLIKGLTSYQPNIDAMQIAEVLWLSQFMEKGKQEKVSQPIREDNPKDEQKNESSELTLPKDVKHTVVISGAKKRDKEYGFEKSSSSGSVYGVGVREKKTFPSIEKQFKNLKIKQRKSHNKLLDEEKTADYMATMGFLHPIYQKGKSREVFFSLHIVVDKGESMFLWQEAIEHFIESVKFSSYFHTVQIFHLDSSKSRASFTHARSKRAISSNSSIFRKEKTLTLIFSDTVGLSWKSEDMFELMQHWSARSFVTIVSMLPKRMWQNTPLRRGLSLSLKSRKITPKNSDLKAEFDFIERKLGVGTLKIPVIPFDENSFSSLSKLLTAQKESWIDARIFKKFAYRTVEEKKQNNVDAHALVENFFSLAPPNARLLAIYCSVLPLNEEIIKEVIRLKELGDDTDAFAEFYFGGLLDKELKVKIGEYSFHKGVRRELLQYLSMDEAKILFELLNRTILNTLGVEYGLSDLLHEQNIKGEGLSQNEKELVELLIEILGEKGKFYKHKIESLRDKKDTIYLETNTYQMGSNEYSNEQPIHTITFDYNFEIAKTPVTFEEYDLYCEDKGVKKPNDEGWGRGKRPVINVNWNDAQNYCDWLNEKLEIEKDSLYRYRLPTEAEWEYACRAGMTTKWSFGDGENELGDYAWYRENSDNKTHEVATKKENPWGLFDMYGNVWEWCQDDWIDNYNDTPRDGKEYKNSSSDRKVLHGGSWFDNSYSTRSAIRDRFNPTFRNNSIGFRLLRTLP